MKLDNETVNNWAKTTYDLPKDASIQDVCFSTAFIAAHEMALDLLDARAKLAIAVKALEEIRDGDLQHNKIACDALKEIQG